MFHWPEPRYWKHEEANPELRLNFVSIFQPGNRKFSRKEQPSWPSSFKKRLVALQSFYLLSDICNPCSIQAIDCFLVHSQPNYSSWWFGVFQCLFRAIYLIASGDVIKNNGEAQRSQRRLKVASETSMNHYLTSVISPLAYCLWLYMELLDEQIRGLWTVSKM